MKRTKHYEHLISNIGCLNIWSWYVNNAWQIYMIKTNLTMMFLWPKQGILYNGPTIDYLACRISLTFNGYITFHGASKYPIEG